MPSIFPPGVWDVDTFNHELMTALDQSFDHLRQTPDFENRWRDWNTVDGTKTLVRQSPLLGNGSAGRDVGGFWLFAQRHITAEGNDPSTVGDRCGFERYQDFSFYTRGDWYAGEKELLMVAEAESNPNELLGELSGLISIRCQHKYLFITGRDTLARLTKYCDNQTHRVFDWPGTTYFVVEVPDEPSRPSSWMAFRADVRSADSRLVFRKAV